MHTGGWLNFLRRLAARIRPPLLEGGGLTRDFMASGPTRHDTPRLLFVALYDPGGIATIREQVEQWCLLSKYRFDLLNLWGLRRRGKFAHVPGLRLQDYAGIVVHCTTAYDISTLVDFDRSLAGGGLGHFAGAKLMMKQDEHYMTHRTAEFLGTRGFHAVITMARPREYLDFYPTQLAGTLRFIPGLTGFVSDTLRTFPRMPLAARTIDVGYRGSMQPWNFGRLAWEKFDIGERFRVQPAARGLALDISSRWEDRIAGDRWLGFLGSCRAVLGVESGASIVDYDGEVARRTQEWVKAHPGGAFEEAFRDVLAPFEGNAYYRAVSPRHFEAAACGCVQVLYEGEYNGIFRADEHYIPLRRDLSNMEDVVSRLRDVKACSEMVERALNDIVLNEQYSYESFIRRFDAVVDELLVTAPDARSSSSRTAAMRT